MSCMSVSLQYFFTIVSPRHKLSGLRQCGSTVSAEHASPWVRVHSEKDTSYFCKNTETGEATWVHPLRAGP